MKYMKPLSRKGVVCRTDQPALAAAAAKAWSPGSLLLPFVFQLSSSYYMLVYIAIGPYVRCCTEGGYGPKGDDPICWYELPPCDD
jgi:hypothetical protein